MPHYNQTAAPETLDLPSYVINYDIQHGEAEGIQFQCWARQFTPSVDDEQEDIESFCNPRGTRPGATTRSMDVEVLMTIELWNYLKPLEKKLVTFAMLRDSSLPVSVANPEISGLVWVPSIPDFVEGGVGSIEPVSLTFNEYQTINRVVATTVAAAATTHPL